MTSIADDEVRHAALAWQVARWAHKQLSPAAQQRVSSARQAAVALLRSEVTTSMDPELQQRAGLPPSSVALDLVEQLAQTLWA
jgi:ABC-type polar amino acid transport system ATPase subunit